MISVHIQTLIVSHAPAPSIVVLQEVGEEPLGNKPIQVVPIWIGTSEATQLGVALKNARFARPITHDLFIDALTNLDARVDHVFISDVEKTTFFAKLVLNQHGRLIELDARPSDALALAVRQGAPIFMDEEVFEKASYPYFFKKSSLQESEIDKFSEFIEGLAPEDFKA